MAFFPVVSFLVLLAFGSVGSWASCINGSYRFGGPVLPISGCRVTLGSQCGASVPNTYQGTGNLWYADCSLKYVYYCGNRNFYVDCATGGGPGKDNEYHGGEPGSCGGGSYCTSGFNSDVFCTKRCDNKCDADSVACLSMSGYTWNSESCSCEPPVYFDSTWVCDNAGGPEEGGFGGPYIARTFRCYGPACILKRTLPGSCQDWGFCDEGVEHCEIPDSLGNPPCGRSGPRFVTSPKCVYACADGKDKQCNPISTQYVAGAVYAGECPTIMPAGCRELSSSSGSGSAESSASSPLSSSSSLDWRDTIAPGTNIDYTAILAAILDTLHRANVQRDFVLELENNMSLDLDNISNYSEFSYNELSEVNSTLSGIANNGIPFDTAVAADVSAASDFLGSINSYLRSDSLLSGVSRGDTVYNPLLRDIRAALDSLPGSSAHDSSVFARDSAFARWFAQYANDSVLSGGFVGDALRRFVGHMDDFSDSVKARGCSGYLGCMSVYKDMAYCSNAWSVTLEDCAEGGTPLDGIWTTETSILSTLFDFFKGDSTLDWTPSPVDSAVSFSPAVSAAYAAVSSASGILDAVDISGMLSHARELVDSAKKARTDSVKVQPDSMWLDSVDAAKYVSNILMPSGTSTDCFVCHADLGTFGGLSDTSLAIHIDFSNFGGYDWCALIRAVVKIASLVVCISLTLGSWLAAFGYNPKNDA